MAFNPTAHRLGICTVAVLTALGVSACGSSEKKTAPSAYVSQVCTAIGGLLRTMETDGALLSKEVGKLRNSAEGRAALSHAVNSMLDAANQAVAGLKAAGVPDVSEGKAISKHLIGAFEEVRSLLINDERRLAGQQATTGKSTAEAAHQLDHDIENSLSSVGASLGQLHSAKLSQAASTAPACQALASQGGAIGS
jgi:hypothetical protein